jgi:hypothetical protein
VNIPEIMPTELSGFCDVATGDCVVIDTDTDAATAHGSATDDTAQPLAVPDDQPLVVPDDRPARAVPKGS